MVIPSNLGFPRIGPRRELKKSLEDFWSGKIGGDALQQTGRDIRAQNWRRQKDAGLLHIPSNDFSFYDHVLDTAVLVDAVPRRFPDYFAAARGVQKTGGADVPALEMTKWFDTNYHYIVPEFTADQAFQSKGRKAVEEFEEAKAAGVLTRPVLLGPVSFLLLGKSAEAGWNPWKALDRLLPVYADILKNLAAAGADWVQMDEPCLVTDLPPEAATAFQKAYETFAKTVEAKLLLTTYFGDLRENLDWALSLPVAGLHLDLLRAPGQLDRALKTRPQSLRLSLGLVDGRNIWRADLDAAVAVAERAAAAVGADKLLVAPSCSLLHTPVDLAHETVLDPELRSWLAFAQQKLEEVAVIAFAVNDGRAAAAPQLDAAREALARRRASPRLRNKEVLERLAVLRPEMSRRQSPFPHRRHKQQAALSLPSFPTTTIGSFPQTPEVRAARAAFKTGKTSAADYDAFLKKEIERTVRFQEDVGLDVLVHGEPERNDMVEYFGEQLAGFAMTRNGWVQSYGSRCVKPPVIFGDVHRPKPMTVEWSRHAQSLTRRPMKGMLTGPVTILQWSFVRNDQPRADTCRQIALALRDEVLDLEKAGLRVIQIDEPALREGLPLRRDEWDAYLAWAVESFRLAANGVKDETQTHTHMCYAAFNDIIEAIAALDADVISLEASRSGMELLRVFRDFRYPNDIGPGAYDIHSPRVPSAEEMEKLMEKALDVIPAERLWVNPDCGLKTRRWEEVKPALENLVRAARRLRGKIPVGTGRG